MTIKGIEGVTGDHSLWYPPVKLHTTCKNRACVLHSTCNHNIWKHGLKCAGNEKGFSYKSSQQSIYGDYVVKCKREGTEPMNRFHYFEF